jgi:NADPH2 dehydrogenase
MVLQSLFRPIRVGNLQLRHRIVHAPTSRFRTNENNVILPIVAEYYKQRSQMPGTLLIAEASLIHPRAGGMYWAPGIWSEEQIKAWKMVIFDNFVIRTALILVEWWTTR